MAGGKMDGSGGPVVKVFDWYNQKVAGSSPIMP